MCKDIHNSILNLVTGKNMWTEKFELIAKESTPKAAFLPIVQAVPKIYQKNDHHIKVFLHQVIGTDCFVLSDLVVVLILQSMPGLDTCHDYQFKCSPTKLLELL